MRFVSGITQKLIRHGCYLGALALVVGIVSCSSNPAATGNLPAAQDQRRGEVVIHALSMLGRPYRYGGTNSQGFDCSGLVYYSYQQAGLSVPRTTRLQYKSSQKIRQGSLQPGDLLFFRINGGSTDHVGLYLGDGDFIHAPSTGKTVERTTLDSAYWQKRFLHAASFF